MFLIGGLAYIRIAKSGISIRACLSADFLFPIFLIGGLGMQEVWLGEGDWEKVVAREAFDLV